MTMMSVQGKNIILNSGNSVILESAFNSSSTSEISQKISALANPDITNILVPMSSGKVKDIFLILASPGGEIVSGLFMIDFINSIPNVRVHTITLFAASMGFITAQGLGERYITKTGTYMSHKARGSFGAAEFPGQHDSRYNFWIKRLDRIDNSIVKRTKGKHTFKSYRNLMENEYWCEGQECVKQGFADEVANVSCDTSLSGTIIKNVTFSFLGMSATVKLGRAKCPIILGYKKVSATLNGKPYHFNNRVFNLYFDKKIRSFNNFNSVK